MDEPKAVDSNVNVEETNPTSQVETETTREEVNNESRRDEAEIHEEQPKESDSVVEKKPSRAERRINQLTSKLKSQGTPQSNDIFGENLPPWWGNQQLDPNREYTLDELNQIQEQKSAAKAYTAAQIAIAQERQRNQLCNLIENHSKELQEISKSEEFTDENFDARFTKLYQEINFDESGNFKPKMGPKELYEIVKGNVKMGESRGMASASRSMAETIANAAVTPNASRTEDPDARKNEALRKAYESGSAEDLAEYLKLSIVKS